MQIILIYDQCPLIAHSRLNYWFNEQINLVLECVFIIEILWKVFGGVEFQRWQFVPYANYEIV